MNSKKAAEYIRMSTDKQIYSIENQRSFIAGYAFDKNIEIIKSYVDGGKSGVLLKGRDGLQSLLSEVISGKAKFNLILVYDVSRWGRFQDVDEAAHYEFICRRAGVDVIYVAEQFINDSTPISSILKSIKRAMAGEYSRELSDKVFQSQIRRAEVGNYLGGPANYGLRRYFYDQNGVLKGVGNFKEWKSHKTYYVKLGPGPENEVKEVKEIFRKFAEFKWIYQQICEDLIERNVPPPEAAKSWNAQLIRKILGNEKYIGSMTFYKTTEKLYTKMRKVPAELQVVVPDAFKAVIEPELFEKAQSRLLTKNIRMLDREKMLNDLREIYKENKRISSSLMRKKPSCHAPLMYRKYFGSLDAAYKLVGFNQEKQESETLKKFFRTREINKSYLKRLMLDLQFSGLNIKKRNYSGLTIMDCLVVSVSAAGYDATRDIFRVDLKPDIDVVVTYLDFDGDTDSNCYMIPRSAFQKKCVSTDKKKLKEWLLRWQCNQSFLVDRLRELALAKKRFC